MERPKRERLAELVRRLEAAPRSRDAGAALELITTVLEQVEDELTDIPNDPSTPRADERIWPPIDKYHFEIPGRPDLDGYRQRGHETIVRANGAFLVRTRLGSNVILDKPGHDGRKVNP